MHFNYNPEWYAPRTIEETIGIIKKLKREGADFQYLAGGTDLNVKIRDGALLPENIISISGIARLAGIDHIPAGSGQDDIILREGGTLDLIKTSYLSIGSGTCFSDIKRNLLVLDQCRGLAHAAGQVGSPQIRNIATIGGNVSNASPAGDVATMLTALSTIVITESPSGKLGTHIGSFFKGVGRTVMSADELITKFLIPISEGSQGSGFYKLKKRKAVVLSVVNSGAILVCEQGVFTKAGVSLGAVAVTPLLLDDAEDILIGKSIDAFPELLPRIGEAARDMSRPITDVRATKEYRKEMTKITAERALQRAFDNMMENIDRGRN